MEPLTARYLRTQFVNHARLFFEESAAALLESDEVRFLPRAEIAASRGQCVVIPVDIPVPDSIESAWQVAFNGTSVNLWNRVPCPDGEGWQAVPNDLAPVWYRHTSGTLTPAWNLFGNVFELLTFGEERKYVQRDHHGRFVAAYSPRRGKDLLEVPAVNEAVALLVAARAGVKENGQPAFGLNGLVKPPVVVLSHDCDLLLGNDVWTQSVRIYRTVRPLARLRSPQLGNIWWLLRNMVAPRRFYFDNATGIIDIERCFGYTSTYYLLNGSGGRFGARSPFGVIPKLLEYIPARWDVGMHYNYDTLLNQERFAAQLEQLRRVAPAPIVSGRAHYLKFDPFRSFPFLRQFGIYADESSGYPERVGYRNGIAGCFQAFDSASQAALDIWEIPMVFMETALVEQYGSRAVSVVERHLQHLSRIGGALTILVHPGLFFNPEHSRMLGIYHGILKACRQAGATSETARCLVDRLRK